jgi:hypothetical protein
MAAVIWTVLRSVVIFFFDVIGLQTETAGNVITNGRNVDIGNSEGQYMVEKCVDVQLWEVLTWASYVR